MEANIKRWRNANWKVVERQMNSTSMVLELRRIALAHSIEQIADERDRTVSIGCTRAASFYGVNPVTLIPTCGPIATVGSTPALEQRVNAIICCSGSSTRAMRTVCWDQYAVARACRKHPWA